MRKEMVMRYVKRTPEVSAWRFLHTFDDGLLRALAHGEVPLLEKWEYTAGGSGTSVSHAKIAVYAASTHATPTSGDWLVHYGDHLEVMDHAAFTATYSAKG